MKIITDSRCVEYSHPGHPERPERIARTLEHLRLQSELALTWAEPDPSSDEALLRAHASPYLRRLEEPLDFDVDTPTYPDLAGHARRSAGGALLAMDLALKGEPAFSLMRPPGHHATRTHAMGFCYLSNAAIAVLAARAAGVDRIAVFDFDVHHGNGTEDILLDQPGCATFSIHQWPAYPGTGQEHRNNCSNYPVPPGTPRENYRIQAEQALSDLEHFRPDLVAVSAGFDAYARDPLCQQRLEPEDFHWYGQAFRQMGVPVFSVLEGGYSSELPDLVLNYLLGLEGLDYRGEPPKPTKRSEPASRVIGTETEISWGPPSNPFSRPATGQSSSSDNLR